MAVDEAEVPPEVLQLWTEVGNGLDKNQTGACGFQLRQSVSHSVAVLFSRAGYVEPE